MRRPYCLQYLNHDFYPDHHIIYGRDDYEHEHEQVDDDEQAGDEDLQQRRKLGCLIRAIHHLRRRKNELEASG